MGRSPRSDARRTIEGVNRVVLLENDVDELDDRFDTLEDRIDGKFDLMNARIGKMLWAMVGVLVSVTTASILFALNLVTGQ